MKTQFPQYANIPNAAYRNIWRSALFIFDTSVLLNLYRYRASARDELLDVLNKLSDRIWIPHHVALEFYRNRLKVISEQNRVFTEVENAVKKAKNGLTSDLEKLHLQTRHSLINPQPFISELDKLSKKFLNELKQIQDAQQKPTANDLLKEKIESLFSSRVGEPNKSQDEVDKIYKQAEERFKLRIPPGFLDSEKGSKEGASGHIHNGIIYREKYGDYLIWTQILSHVAPAQAKSVIFVTSDAKDDWWDRINFDGIKTIGPRPELIDEMRLVGRVDHFLMYKMETFLEHSKEFLKAHVSKETLEEVRDVSTSLLSFDDRFVGTKSEAALATELIMNWLEPNHESVMPNFLSDEPHILALNGGHATGYNVKLFRPHQWGPSLMKTHITNGLSACRVLACVEAATVWIIENPAALAQLKILIVHVSQDIPEYNMRMLVGMIDASKSDQATFSTVADFTIRDARSLHNQLTEREQTILDLLANNKSQAVIASELDLSVETVQFHQSQIRRKLGVLH